MIYLKKELLKSENNNNILFYYGVNSSNDIIYSEVDRYYTMDGSIGEKGYITQDLLDVIHKKKIEIVYTCGPEPMLERIQELLMHHPIPVFTSLEERMACGIGACYGCAVKIMNDNDFSYKRVCKDGPIFDLKKVVFND